MSGTSLDGVDLAYCIFKKEQKKWSYKIIHATTYNYNNNWKEKLKTLNKKDAFTFVKTNIEYGHFLGRITKKFITKNNISADFIVSHGHTIFHQPDKKITCQIGDGVAITAETNIPVICNLRSLDVALNGQGAPLVPVGDKLLFSNFEYCLNLGGFANISYDDKNNNRIAYDICPVNIIINNLTEKTGKKYDDKGNIAKKGNINNKLLKDLNNISFYKQLPPKSLSIEWLYKYFIPVLNNYNISINDKLNTIYEHIAIQISIATSNYKEKNILVTGGGTFNTFLINRIKANVNHKIIIPDKNIINYKEALIFAFLGVLRIRKEINCLSSVTGAKKNTCNGAVFFI